MRQDRLLEIVGRIYQRPETWDQHVYHCDTSHCVAGHAQIDAGKYCPGTWRSAWPDAVEWLELSKEQAGWLFDFDRTLPELIHFATTGRRP